MPGATSYPSRKRPAAAATRSALPQKRPAAEAEAAVQSTRTRPSKRPAAVGVTTTPEDSLQEGFTPILVAADGSRYTGELMRGKYHGHGELTLPNGSICSGTFDSGRPCGRCTLYDPEKETLLSGWYINGKLHSAATKVDARTGRLIFRGRYEDDKPVGMAEVFEESNARVIGFVDDKGTLTGNDIIYVFPDGRTALAGTFHNGAFQSGRYGRLRVPLELPPPPPPLLPHSTASSEAGSSGPSHPKPLWSRMLLSCEAPAPDEQHNACPYADDFMANSDSTMALLKGVFGDAALSSASSTRTMVKRLGFEAASECGEVVHSRAVTRRETSDLRVCDLYEVDRVEVKRSTLTDGTDGLFAVVDISAGEFCAWQLPGAEETAECLGHKVNRGPDSNVKQDSFNHPRFGTIQALRAVRNISKGSEILL